MNNYFSADNENNDFALVKRFENYLKEGRGGYFDVEELLQMTDYYIDREMFENALNAIDLGLKIHPNNSALYTQKAITQLLTEHLVQAYDTIHKVTEQTEESLFTKIEILARLYLDEELTALIEENIKVKLVNTDEVLEEIASIYLQDEHYQTAIKWLERSIQYNPNDCWLHIKLGNCLGQIKEYKKAKEILLKAIQIDPYSYLAWMHLGDVYDKLNNPTKALECFEFSTAIEEGEQNIIAVFRKANMLFELDKWQEARETYESISHQFSEKKDIYSLIAECYEYEENYQKALTYYRSAEQESDEEQEDIMEKIAICNFEIGAYQDAIFYCIKTLNINKDAIDTWVCYGQALLELGKIEEAVQALKKAISIDPDQPAIQLLIGGIYYEHNQYEIAKNYFLQAYQYDQTLENIELLIATTNFYTKDYTQMEKYLELAINRNLDAQKLFVELCPEIDTESLSIIIQKLWKNTD